MKKKRTKACDITTRVKNKVWERDNFCCIKCGNPEAMPNAHYISRAQGGLGIEQNIVTLCIKCHDIFDHSSQRQEFREFIRNYLIFQYGESWSEENLIYKK